MKKIILFKFLSTLFSIVIIILTLEIYVRHALDDGFMLDLEMMKYAKGFKEISKNKDIGIEHKKNVSGKIMRTDVFLNSDGFRNKYDVNSQKKKILMLGDSMTFGFGAQQTFSSYLEKKLSEDYQVINAGIGNTNTKMQISNFFENFSKYNYDVLVLNFFINDFEDVKIREISFLQKNFYSYTFVKSKIINILVKFGFLSNWEKFYHKTFQNTNLINETFSLIKKLKQYCEKNNIVFIINNIPELKDLKNYKFFKETNLIKSFAKNNGIYFFNSMNDLKNFDEKSLWVSEEDRHANNKAHKIISNFLYNKILSLI